MANATYLEVGPQVAGDGATIPSRAGRGGDQIVTELHGRFYELNFRGSLFSGGMALTSINAATFTTGTLGATCTPIMGVWNPGTSPVNLVILQATIGITLTSLTATGGGPFVWATSIGNNAISTGTAPLNRKTLLLAGSQAKHFPGVALTGLTNNLVVSGAAPIGGGSAYNISVVGTAAGMHTGQPTQMEAIEGGWMVPPGGVLALLATATPVAHSAVSQLIWAEVPL